MMTTGWMIPGRTMIPSGGHHVFIAITSVFLVASVFGNVLVVLVVIRNKKMRNVTNLLISNLAVSDIVFGGCVIPQAIHDISHTEKFYEGDVLCRLVNFLPIWCIATSIYTIMFMSIERYRSIVLSFSVQLSKRKVKYVIALTWLGAVLIGSPTIVEYHVYTAHSGNESHLACGSEGVTRMFSILNALMLLFICYVIPLIVICVNYGRIILFILKRTARRHVPGINLDIQVPGPSQANQPSSSTGKGPSETTRNPARSVAAVSGGLSNSAVSKNKVRILKMLAIVALLFALSWLPYFTVLIIAKMTGSDDSAESAGPVSLLRIALSVFSVSYNPVLYTLYNQNFRDGFRELLCCKKANQIVPFTATVSAVIGQELNGRSANSSLKCSTGRINTQGGSKTLCNALAVPSTSFRQDHNASSKTKKVDLIAQEV